GGRWMMTARLDIRYRRAALLDQTLRISARAISVRSRAVTAKGEVRLADDPSVIIAEAEGTFLAITARYQQEMIARHPELASFYEQ
ncbi:MAG: hotdog fold domain-containing protein, partial [Ktedonobacterales bacterium]